MQNFAEYYRALPLCDRKSYCERAGVSQRYIESHLVYRSKRPTPETIKCLADASAGALTYTGLLAWFNPEPLAHDVA